MVISSLSHKQTLSSSKRAVRAQRLVAMGLVSFLGSSFVEQNHCPELERIFGSYMFFSMLIGGAALYGCVPPDPAVHWPGHSWIHFMKRVHVILSIGCFLIEMCAAFFSLFALHRVLAGGFNARASSAAALLVRELEFEFVAVCSYFFAGAWLLMGPVAIRCFCMVQQGVRSHALAAAVCCLIVGTVLLVVSFFNAHLVSFPYDSYDGVVVRFVQLSLTRCQHGGRPAVRTRAIRQLVRAPSPGNHHPTAPQPARRDCAAYAARAARPARG